MTKIDKINLISNNLEKINIDCSRFENTYGGYQDSRDWYMQYVEGEISLKKYLNNISEQILDKMIQNL